MMLIFLFTFYGSWKDLQFFGIGMMEEEQRKGHDDFDTGHEILDRDV